MEAMYIKRGKQNGGFCKTKREMAGLLDIQRGGSGDWWDALLSVYKYDDAENEYTCYKQMNESVKDDHLIHWPRGNQTSYVEPLLFRVSFINPLFQKLALKTCLSQTRLSSHHASQLLFFFHMLLLTTITIAAAATAPINFLLQHDAIHARLEQRECETCLALQLPQAI